MKNEEVIYGNSFEMPGYWEKIGFKGQLEKGETIESALDNYKKRLEAWHKKNHPEMYGGKVIKKESEKTELTPEEMASWKKLVTALTKIGNKEDALEYLENDKEWSMAIEAKQIANSLPSKNKK